MKIEIKIKKRPKAISLPMKQKKLRSSNPIKSAVFPEASYSKST